MVAYYGWDDLIFTHLSARIPGPEHHFLLNPYNLMFEEVTASSLVKVDVNGNPVEPTPFITNPAGFTIHSAIHMAREDAHAVMHLHTPAGQAVSAHSEGLLPLTQTAMLIRGDLAFHDYEGVAVDLDERERLVADLGDKNAMILRNHGTLAVGKNVGECFVRLYFLERACQAQIMALSAGDNVNNPPQGSPEVTAQQGAVGRRAGRQPARLAGAQAQGLPPRPELRDLSLGGKAGIVSDYRALAKARLPHFLFEYLDGGSYDEVTLRRNIEDLQAVALEAARAARRVFASICRPSCSASAGRCRSGSGRSGLSGLYARRGEVQAAKAAQAAGVPFTLSTLAAARSAKSRKRPPLWFQLYIVKDRGFVSDMIAQAKDAGCGALLLTVDLAVAGTAIATFARGCRGRCVGRAARTLASAAAARLGVGRRRSTGGR